VTNLFRVRHSGAARSETLGPDQFRFLATVDETGGSYSLLEVDVPVGSGPPPHVHAESEEWFYVLRGHAVFHLDGISAEARAGDHVHIPRGVTHSFEVTDEDLTVLIGFSPGGEEQQFLPENRTAEQP